LKFYGLQRKEISKIRAIERAFIDVLWSTLVVVSESCSRPTPCFLDLATRAYAGVYLLHKKRDHIILHCVVWIHARTENEHGGPNLTCTPKESSDSHANDDQW